MKQVVTLPDIMDVGGNVVNVSPSIVIDFAIVFVLLSVSVPIKCMVSPLTHVVYALLNVLNGVDVVSPSSRSLPVDLR